MLNCLDFPTVVFVAESDVCFKQAASCYQPESLRRSSEAKLQRKFDWNIRLIVNQGVILHTDYY